MNKVRIIFVDDEQNILDGLRRMLRIKHQEWEMEFATSGQNALEIMERNPCDIVVSDMRMPGMSGVELLERVMKKYPKVVRLILSGHSDQEMILRSVHSAHQFLSKPCNADDLIATISRSFSLHSTMANHELQSLISKMDRLPSLPTLYMEIMNELQSQDSSIANVGKIIEKDIGMSAKILQIVNSAFFGLPQQVTSPSHAVSLLGLDVIKALALTVQVFSQFENTQLRNLSISALWKHSEKVAQFSKLIFLKENNDKKATTYAMIAGFLHDIGKLIFMTNTPENYNNLLTNAINKKIPLYQVEQDVLGVNHGEVGAYLLNIWGLPDPVVEAIAFHHNPIKVPVKTTSPLMTVHVANIIEHKIAVKEDNAFLSQSFDTGYLDELGLTNRIEEWEKLCRDSVKDNCPDS